MKRSMRYIITGVAVVFLILVSGCVSQAPATPTPAPTEPTQTPAPTTPGQTTAPTDTTLTSVAVEIKGFAFNPATVTISKGTTVTWTQEDSTTHSVTGTGFDSGGLSQGQTFSHTFNEAGTFDYGCSFHPSMNGTVIVT